MDNIKFLAYARTALKNLFQKPATTAYPYEEAVFPERMRGHIEIRTENCICCGLCMRSCPPGAIQVNRGEAVWTINRFDCVQCGSCVNVCPKQCLSMEAGYTKPQTEITSETFVIPGVAAQNAAKKEAALQKKKEEQNT